MIVLKVYLLSIKKCIYRVDKKRFIALVISVIASSIFIGAKGPIVLTLITTSLLLVYLSGIGFKPQSFHNVSKLPAIKSIVSHWGPIIIYHSHHGPESRIRGKEFKIGHKYFCTGCYGGFFGLIIAIVMLGFHLFNGFDDYLLLPMLVVLPFSFIPIILRYTVFRDMSSIPRFLSNMLLTVGCSVLLIVSDIAFQNWILNGTVTIMILLIAEARKIASISEEDMYRQSNGNA